MRNVSQMKINSLWILLATFPLLCTYRGPRTWLLGRDLGDATSPGQDVQQQRCWGRIRPPHGWSLGACAHGHVSITPGDLGPAVLHTLPSSHGVSLGSWWFFGGQSPVLPSLLGV